MKTKLIKGDIEKSVFCDYVIEIWKRKSHEYVANYIRGAILKRDDMISEELLFLYKLRKSMAE